MNASTSTTKRAGRAALAASMLIGSLAVGALDGGAAHAAVVYDGSSPARAAASCWEVKQVAPNSASGAYWLLTPALQGPQQFYCDQETDGGGWVMIGKGREGWQEFYNGQGDAATLLNPPTPRTPSYFNTVQLPASTVDDLLDHRHVKDLTDGIRLLRARNSTGTQWQEVRMRLSRRDRFVWTFGAIHPIQNYGFDGSNTTGGTTNNFGNDSTWRRVTFSQVQNQNWTIGFAYGGSATGGSTAADNFLYSALSTGGSSRPYTEVYLRPRLTQADLNWTAIPDAGTAKFEQRAMASSYAARGEWGVTGHLNGNSAERNQEVQDFVQIGNRMFVAGNFQYVQRGSGTQNRVNQAALAAFDVNTGAYIATFTPQFNNQVKGVAKLPNGKLIAVGDFSTVNGTTATGTVVLDPITGAIDPSWRVDIENRISSGVRSVTTVDVHGDFVYIAGAFTHVGSSPTSSKVYARAAARIQWATGSPDGSWNPEFNGTVIDNDMSADGNRMYAAGFFTQSLQGDGTIANKAAAVRTVPGAPLEAWSPVWSASDRSNYQQAIREAGNRVFVGGSEHSIFAFDTTSFQRTSGSTTQGRGGDFQAIGTGHGVVYGGQHAEDWNYENNFTWPAVGTTWTQADKTRWIGAYDAVSGEFLPTFNPPHLGAGIAGARRGVWAIYVDEAGTVWAGGDLNSVRYNPSSSQWAGGFVRFPLVDHIAPSTPTGVQVTVPSGGTATMSWNASSDDSGSVQYEVLRNDRVVATTSTRTATIAVENADRLFVRAVDAEGNRSASTTVYDLSAPTTTTTTPRPRRPRRPRRRCRPRRRRRRCRPEA
jgi:trimeric autotransporter adhesin